MEKLFCERLKAIRIENGLSQKQTAEKLELSSTCYAGYEQGYRQPDLKTLKKICLLFEISADFLLGIEN